VSAVSYIYFDCATDATKSVSVITIAFISAFILTVFSLMLLQVFYTSFFSPDKDLYPDEIFFTDSLATALVVRMYSMRCLFVNDVRMLSSVYHCI